MRTKVFSLIFFLSVTAFSETHNLTTSQAGTETELGFLGSLDVRPEYNSGPKTFDIFYEVMLGHQITRNTNLSYVQWLTTNVYDPFSDNKGTNLTGDDGFIRLEIENIYKSGGFQIAYENRLVLPTSPTKAVAGMVLENQSRIKLIQEWGNWSIALLEIPVGQIYQNASYEAPEGLTANPGFGNYVYFFLDYNFSEKIAFSFPFLFESTLNRISDGAINSGKWVHELRIWPEITYALTPKLKIGLAYYSGTFISSEADSLAWENINNDASTQLTFQFTL